MAVWENEAVLAVWVYGHSIIVRRASPKHKCCSFLEHKPSSYLTVSVLSSSMRYGTRSSLLRPHPHRGPRQGCSPVVVTTSGLSVFISATGNCDDGSLSKAHTAELFYFFFFSTDRHPLLSLRPSDDQYYAWFGWISARRHRPCFLVLENKCAGVLVTDTLMTTKINNRRREIVSRLQKNRLPLQS